MKNIVLLICTLAILISCKSKETRVYEYAQNFNKGDRLIESTYLKQAKAYYLNKQSVNIDFILNSAAETGEQFEQTEFLSLLDLALKRNPEGKALVDENVNLNIRIYNKYGIKIIEFPLTTYSTADFVIAN